MPHGGPRPNSGRPKNAVRKIDVLSVDTSAAPLARPHATEAIDTLREVMQDAEAEAGPRVSAARALLEFGYGKPGSGTDLIPRSAVIRIKDAITGAVADEARKRMSRAEADEFLEAVAERAKAALEPKP